MIPICSSYQNFAKNKRSKQEIRFHISEIESGYERTKKRGSNEINKTKGCIYLSIIIDNSDLFKFIVWIIDVYVCFDQFVDVDIREQGRNINRKQYRYI